MFTTNQRLLEQFAHQRPDLIDYEQRLFSTLAKANKHLELLRQKGAEQSSIRLFFRVREMESMIISLLSRLNEITKAFSNFANEQGRL